MRLFLIPFLFLQVAQAQVDFLSMRYAAVVQFDSLADTANGRVAFGARLTKTEYGVAEVWAVYKDSTYPMEYADPIPKFARLETQDDGWVVYIPVTLDFLEPQQAMIYAKDSMGNMDSGKVAWEIGFAPRVKVLDSIPTETLEPFRVRLYVWDPDGGPHIDSVRVAAKPLYPGGTEYEYGFLFEDTLDIVLPDRSVTWASVGVTVFTRAPDRAFKNIFSDAASFKGEFTSALIPRRAKPSPKAVRWFNLLGQEIARPLFRKATQPIAIPKEQGL